SNCQSNRTRDYKPGHSPRPVVSRKPFVQIDDDPGKKSGLRTTQQETSDVELGGSVHEAHQDGADAPGDQNPSHPPARAPFLNDESSGDLQNQIADKKQAGSQTINS